MTVPISSLSELDDRYDAVLIDQFGVLHDGRSAFPGTIACMQALADRHVPVVALSNSGKRAELNAERLERLGFFRGWFRAVITSGELAYGRIGEMLAARRLTPGDGIAILSRDGDASAIEGHGLRRIDPGPNAALLLIAGVEPENRTREDYRAAIAPMAEAGVPALCINPDLHIYANGARAFGPGLIAEDYRAAGGEVTLLGKPGAEMFDAGLAMLGSVDPARVLMIGDSPQHDIAGAKAAGCITLLVQGGVQGAGESGEPDFIIDTLR